MRSLMTSIVVVLSMGLLAPAAYADLSSSTYSRAKEEYEKGFCRKAQPLLKQYKKEDDNFLKGNPTDLYAINDAIDYCQYILFPTLSGTTFSFRPPPPQKPDLPPGYGVHNWVE